MSRAESASPGLALLLRPQAHLQHLRSAQRSLCTNSVDVLINKYIYIYMLCASVPGPRKIPKVPRSLGFWRFLGPHKSNRPKRTQRKGVFVWLQSWHRRFQQWRSRRFQAPKAPPRRLGPRQLRCGKCGLGLPKNQPKTCGGRGRVCL